MSDVKIATVSQSTKVVESAERGQFVHLTDNAYSVDSQVYELTKFVTEIETDSRHAPELYQSRHWYGIQCKKGSAGHRRQYEESLSGLNDRQLAAEVYETAAEAWKAQPYDAHARTRQLLADDRARRIAAEREAQSI